MRPLSRKHFLSLGIGAGASLALTGALAEPKGPGPRKRNVVMIVIDDLNDYVTGMGGHTKAKYLKRQR